MKNLRIQYIRLMVWLGAAPPKGYENLSSGKENGVSNTELIALIIKGRRLVLAVIVLISISILSFLWIRSQLREAELKAAYERSITVSDKARKDFDYSNLSEGFTKHGIAIIEKAIEHEEYAPTFIGEEAEVSWVEVLEYNPPEAIIKVKYFYRSYEYNRETKVITYYDKPYRYWRMWKIRMRQEDGIWKFDETLEFVNWSG
jgi:hypothetical protein